MTNLYKFYKLVHMNQTVNISTFRNNIADYLDYAIANNKEITIKRNKTPIARLTPVDTKPHNSAQMLIDLTKGHFFKGDKNLSKDIDKIVYGL